MIMTENRRVDRSRIDPDHALALVQQSNLLGHGGGRFPTATKIAAARGRHPELIINACDGEPLVEKDSVLLQHQPLLVADGIAVVQALVRPRRTVIAVHQGKEQLAAEVIDRGAVAAEILPVPRRYVSSEASALAGLLADGTARPRYRDQPLVEGATGRRGRSVLVLNAETVARIAAVVIRGRGTPTRLLSLTGDLHRPTVIEAPLTTTIDELVLAAGPTSSPRAALVGGYGGRWFDWADLTGRTVEELAAMVGAGLLMVQAQGCPLRTVGEILVFLAEESAGQCGPCMFGLPAIAADWQSLTDPREARAAEERLQRRLPVIAGRGACHHPDGAVTMAASARSVFAADIAAHRSGRCVGRDALVVS